MTRPPLAELPTEFLRACVDECYDREGNPIIEEVFVEDEGGVAHRYELSAVRLELEGRGG